MKKQKKHKNRAFSPQIRCAHSAVVTTSSLRPNPENPNHHGPDQLALYAKILRHQGWRKPIVVSNQSGLIVTGHGAWICATEQGWPAVPVDRQDFASKADEIAHMLADNGLPQMAEIKEDELKKLLNSLDEELRELTAYDPTELEGLLAEDEPEEPKLEIVITCKSQRQQRALLVQLEEQGVKCRAVKAR